MSEQRMEAETAVFLQQCKKTRLKVGSIALVKTNGIILLKTASESEYLR